MKERNVIRCIALAMIIGLSLWMPGLPVAWAQVDVDFRDPALDIAARAEFATLEPDLAAECARVLENCQAAEAPDAPESVRQEAKTVEVTCEAIHQAGETATKLPVPDATEIQTKLTQNAGLDPATAGALAQDAQKTLTEIQKAFAAGDPNQAETLAKSFQEQCQSKYGVDPEVFGVGRETGGMTFDRILAHDNVMEGVIRAHFETAVVREATLRAGGPEGIAGPSPEAMRGMVEQMVACGINPSEVFQGAAEFHGPAGGPGEFQGPSPEAIAAMTPDQKTAYEAWQRGDTTAVNEIAMRDALQAGAEMGMYHDMEGNMVSREQMFREMAQMEQQFREMGEMYREVMEQQAREFYSPEHFMEGFFHEGMILETSYQEPKLVENQNYDNTQQQNVGTYPDGHTECPPGAAHQPGVEQGPGHCQ